MPIYGNAGGSQGDSLGSNAGTTGFPSGPGSYIVKPGSQVVDVPYVLEPGTAGNNVSTPHDAADIPPGDFTHVVCVALDDWSPGTTMAVHSKYDVAATGTFFLNVLPAKTVTLFVSVAGVATSGPSTVEIPIVDGFAIWLKSERTSADGLVDYFYSLDPPSTVPESVTWTSLQQNRATTAGVVTAGGTAATNVGGYNSGATNPAAGKFFRACTYLGLGTAGTKTSDMRPADWSSGTSWVSSTTGETWTLNGTATVVRPFVESKYVPSPAGTGAPRRRLGRVSRRRQPSVPITAVVTVAVTYKPGPSRPQQRKLGVSRRRQSVTVPLTQTVTVTATWTPGPARPQRRPLAVRRRQPVAVPPTATVTFTTSPVRPQRRLVALRRRQPVAVPLTQTVTVTAAWVPPITRPVRRPVSARRGRVSQTPIAPVVVTVSFVPPIGSRRRFAVAARRRQQPVAPLVRLVFIPPISQRRRTLSVRRRKAQPVMLVAVAGAFSVFGSDTGVGSDSGSIVVILSATDSGVGVDVSSIVFPFEKQTFLKATARMKAVKRQSRLNRR